MALIRPLFSILILFHAVFSLENDCECGIADIEMDPKSKAGVQPGMHPWIVRVRRTSHGDMLVGKSVHDCIGLVVSPEYVITSLDCAPLVAINDDLKVELIAGRSEFDEKSWKDDVIELVDPARAYSSSIGIVKLETPLKFSEKIRPICLPEDNNSEGIESVLKIAWDSKGLFKKGEKLQVTDINLKAYKKAVPGDPDRMNIGFVFLGGLKDAVVYKKSGRWYLGGVKYSYELWERIRPNLLTDNLTHKTVSTTKTHRNFDAQHFFNEIDKCSGKNKPSNDQDG